MQATDLLLGLMTDKRTVSQNPLPQTADDSLYSRDSFQAYFDKAMNQTAAKADFNNLASSSRNDYQTAVNEAPRTSAFSAYQAQRAERTSSTVSRQTADKVNSLQPQEQKPAAAP